jgi:hypothetical protein
VVPNARTSRTSARHLAALITDARFATASGTYREAAKIAESSPESHDAARAEELWEQSEQLISEALAGH